MPHSPLTACKQCSQQMNEPTKLGYTDRFLAIAPDAIAQVKRGLKGLFSRKKRDKYQEAGESSSGAQTSSAYAEGHGANGIPTEQPMDVGILNSSAINRCPAISSSASISSSA